MLISKAIYSIWVKVILDIWMFLVVFLYLLLLGPPEFWLFIDRLGLSNILEACKLWLQPFFTAIIYHRVVLFLLIFVYTLYLLRSNRLSPQHAMSWIIAELVMLSLTVFDSVSMIVVRLIGADNTFSAILLLATIWGCCLCLTCLSEFQI